MPDTVSRLNAALEGRYRIERVLGEGGMATVYLAVDLKHNRNVALKVLRPELAAVVGAERFLAEIETTANLQHPHVLPLYDSGEADSLLFYVMPYVEGESLRERLDREHQLPVDDAVRIATNMAEALDYAHRQGVIHRDIKPANVLLQDGKPVISDFGIALAVGAAGGGRLTETGLSLGTPLYMSPEQATGDQVVGPSADIYALGCVLYEMLVGDPPYTGSTAPAILGKILSGAFTPAAGHRPAVPANVDHAIAKALEAIPADRFAAARDFAAALADPGFRYGPDSGVAGDALSTRWKALAILASLVAMVAVSGVVWALGRSASLGSEQVVRFTIPVGEGADVYLGGEIDALWGRPSNPSLAIDPSGEMIVYSAWERLPDGSVSARLYRRLLNQERAEPIQGTEGAYSPFFSPDGEWLAFAVGRSIRRLSMADGTMETVVQDAEIFRPAFSATWGDDGTIVFFELGLENQSFALKRVPATGGEVEMLAPLPESLGGRASSPHLLPGGRTLLAAATRSSVSDHAIVALDLDAEEWSLVLTDAAHPRYVDSGHLLFMRSGTLMAVGFDPASAEVSDQLLVVVEDVMQAQGMPNARFDTRAGQYTTSQAGHLAFAAGGIYPTLPGELERVRFDGSTEALGLSGEDYSRVRVSPDGAQLAFSVSKGRASSLFVHDLARRVTEPLRTEGRINQSPEWSPDGRYIAFESDQDASFGLYRIEANDGGVVERLASSDAYQGLMSWSQDGVIAYLEGGDVWLLRPNASSEPFFTSDASESHATFSPDGRRLAYVADQTGQYEVYVRPYPGPGGATRVSDAGGVSPVWSRDGRRLFFVGGTDRDLMMAAEIGEGPDFNVGAVEALFPWPYATQFPARGFDMLDDESLVVNTAITRVLDFRDDFRVEEFHVVLNFIQELRARAPD